LLAARQGVQIATVAAALCLAVGIGYWFGHGTLPQEGRSAKTPRSPEPLAATTVPPNGSAVELPNNSRWPQKLRDRDARIQQLNSLVEQIRKDRDRLLDDFSAAKATQDQAEQHARDLEQAQQQTSGGLASAQAELAKLNQKLRLQESLLTRQQRLLAVDLEVHNILGDPNLRVLDVQSVNSQGEIEHPFGRVFYAPNRALLVYAFDLDQRNGARPGDRFEVWGSEGVRMAGGHVLGSLVIDEKRENRWMLKCDDVSALSHVDTIYVTTVSSGPLSPQKPLLRAYLSESPGPLR
jgi:hypothetical protein